MSAAIKLCVDRYRYIEKRPTSGAFFLFAKKLKFFLKKCVKIVDISYAI